MIALLLYTLLYYFATFFRRCLDKKEYKNPAPESGTGYYHRGTTLLALQAALFRYRKSDTLAFDNGGAPARPTHEFSACCSQVYFGWSVHRVAPTPGSLKNFSRVLLLFITIG